MIKISVIIPVRNGEPFIARAIDSVLEQSYPAHELIVVDNGSTDQTAAIVQSYHQRQVRLYQHQPPGVSGARNLGALKATGDWLAFLDADDWYYPTRLEAHAKWIEDVPELELLTGNFHYVAAKSGNKRDNFAELPLGRELIAQADEQQRALVKPAQLSSYVARHVGDTHTLSVKRSLYQQVGGYPKNFSVCEDVHLLVRLLAKAQKVGAITMPLAAYYIYAESATRRDPLFAQWQSVQALGDLLRSKHDLPEPIVRGLRESQRLARLDLSYALLREHRKWQAVKQQLQGFFSHPDTRRLRDLGSVLMG